MDNALHRNTEPGKWLAALFSVLMHAVLALFLFYGVHWQRREAAPVSVELVRGLPSAPPPAPTETTPPPPKPQTVPKPEPAPTPKPIVEPPPPKPVAKPDIALKEPKTKKEPPKPEPPKKVIEEPVKKPEPPKKAEVKREPAKPEPKKPEPKETKKPAEPVADRVQQMLENEAKRTSSATSQIKLDAAAKDAASRRAAAEGSSALRKASEEWGDRIRSKVRPNIVRTRDYPGNPTLEFEINLLPDRSIVGEPKLIRSSGHPELDEAVKRAILASSPLPAPPTADAFQRQLNLVFHPMQD